MHRNFSVRRSKTPPENLTALAKWLRRVRIVNELEQVEMAARVGVSRSLISAMERGERDVQLETVNAVLGAFPDAPPPPMGDALQFRGPVLADNKISTIRYVGVVPCDEDWGEALEGQDFVPIDPKFAGKNRFLARVAGPSCEPALHQGDLVIWEHDKAPPYGVIVLAERDGDSACTVKQLVKGKDDEPTLRPVNPKSKAPNPEPGWHATARLVGVIRQADGPEASLYWSPGLKPEHLIREPLMTAAEHRAPYGDSK